ncbi:MAG: DUF6036 family nucleotidyltransferase [Chitinivibrionales bacterium]|nr:DUF6036 family nucleotidyltransferase [Chitinivibrionales bacterium]
MNDNKSLNSKSIISLLHELDGLLKEPCRIIICGGAAAIVAYGLKRLTGDIDTFEHDPKTTDFFQEVKKIGEKHGLDPRWLNEGAKGYSDYLSPDFINRLVPIKHGFKKLDIFAISKPDFITMKICAWRESDKEDIKSLGVTKKDIAVIQENLAYLEKLQPAITAKAFHVLSELGLFKTKLLKSDQVKTLSELILFHNQQKGHDPEIETIRKWQNKINSGTSAGTIAQTITQSKSDNTPD